MPKGTQRSNREKKKPKQQKKPAAVPTSFIARPAPMAPMNDKKK